MELLLAFAKENFRVHDALSAERVNLLGAVTQAYESHRWLITIDYALVLDTFLDTLGYWEEDRHNIELALRASEKLSPDYENRTALLLHDLAVIHLSQGTYERAESYFQQSITLQQRLGNNLAVSRAMHYLGRLCAIVKNYEQARQYFDRSLALGQEAGDKRGVGATFHEMGTLCLSDGDFAGAENFYRRSLAISGDTDNIRDTADTVHQLGILHYRRSEFDQAQNYLEEALRIRQRIAHQEGVAKSLGALGQLAHDRGNLEQAVQLWSESLTLFENLGAVEAEEVRARLSTLHTG